MFNVNYQIEEFTCVPLGYFKLHTINIKITHMKTQRKGDESLFLRVFKVNKWYRENVCMSVSCPESDSCNVLHAMLAQHWECMKTNCEKTMD